ncbi:MAG: hypothetical protein ACFE9Z_07620 [Promethearchaeota archaeon]
MRINTIHPGINLDTIQNSNRFELIIPKDLRETSPPTRNEIKLLREKVDPLNIRKLEVLQAMKEKNC